MAVRTLRFGLTWLFILAWLVSPAAADPVVSVWYRGTPAGTPRQGDLGMIRALGFNGVVWPRTTRAGDAELTRMAEAVGLTVTVADRPAPVTAASARTPGERVDIVVTRESAHILAALAWRAVVRGARAIAFDGGAPSGAGLEEPDGSLKPWVREAVAIARQLSANARLLDLLRPGPGLTIDTTADAGSLDVVLLDGGRSWVIAATNTASVEVRATVRLPAGAPFALWTSWIDGSTLAMVSEAAGPRWMVRIPPGAAQVYLIDKVVK